MKTNRPVIFALLFICLLISTEALGLTTNQLEIDIRSATTGCPAFNITLPTGSGMVESAASFGVSTSNTGGQNYTDFLNAINYCETSNVSKLTVPTGTYYIGSSNSSYGNGILSFIYLTNFIFDGQGSTFIMQSKSDFIKVRYCSQIALQNYTMNWDWSVTPVQSLTEVTNIDSSTNYMDLYYPYESNPAANSLLYELDEVEAEVEETNGVYQTNYDFSNQGAGIIGASDINLTNQVSLGNSTVRFYTTKGNGWLYNQGFRVGQHYLLRHYAYQFPGNDVETNNNLTYSNVTVYSTLGMGFSLINNQYWQIIDSKLIREPGTIYHLSSASDGINNSIGYGYFKLQNDELGNCGDDNINIHDGTSEGIETNGANTLTAENTVDYEDPYHKDDVVELRQGDSSPWNWSSIVTASTDNGSSYALTFSNNLPGGLTTTTILFNHRYNSGNYIISGCYIHDSKGKGAFLHTANGTVENNQFIRNYNPGLFIACINSYHTLGSSYGEGYNPSNIIVQNNTFNGNNIIRNNGVTDTYFPNDIVLVGQTSYDTITPYPICQNIIFQYNLVANSTHASLEIGSATNVLVQNNTFENPCLTNDMTLLGAIIITNSGGVVFDNNALVVDPGVKSYNTNVYVAPSLTNIFVGPFVPRTLPVGWTNYDIGSVDLGGSASYTNGNFTVNGSGVDIWGTNDSFQFVYQPWTGDGQIVAQVTSIQNTAPAAKAGLMFRETLDPGSAEGDLFVNPTNGGVKMQGRTMANNLTSSVNTISGGAPCWLQLVRSGNVLSGYESTNGVNWTLVGTNVYSMTNSIYVGLCVTADSNTVLNTSTFTNVSVTTNSNTSYNYTVGWTNPPSIVYGTELSEVENNATSSILGTFTYDPTNGAILPAGTNVLTTVFTPTSTNYLPTELMVTLVVTPAPLTITANAQYNVYGSGQSSPVTGSTAFTPAGLQNGDTVGSVTLTYGAGALLTNSAAGSTSSIMPGAATNGTFDANNYTITYIAGTLMVTAAPLTITADPQNKVYGANLILGAEQTNFTSVGLQNGETVGSVTLTCAGATNTAPVGIYPIFPSMATGGSFNQINYGITYSSNGDLTVIQSMGLPPPWTNADIGSVGVQGNATYTNGTFTVSGSGMDIWSSTDSFQYVYQSWTGNVEVVAQVTSVSNTATSAKGALMIRETTNADSRNVTLFVSPTNGVSMQARTATGGLTATINHYGGLLPPQWLQLIQLGTNVFGYQSADDVNWTFIGQTNFTATNIYVGMAVTSKSNTVLNTSTFDNVTVNGWQSGDIGDVGVEGSSQINSNGVFTIAGSGTDIWSTNDAFQYFYQTASGDEAMVAQVLSVSNTASSAKAALMIRETTNANSCNTTLFLSPTNGISLQGRTSTDGLTINVSHAGGLPPPQWLMLVRSSANMNGYQSVDGTNWSWIGTQSNGIASSYYIGLAVTSKSNTVLNTSTFDNVSVQSAWTSGDVGSVGVAGNTEIDDSTGTFTVSGSGTDIWGTNDAFQYVYQPLYGDGQIVAYVSVGSSYPPGKAGVMIRDTLSADSEDALLFVGTNGVSFQGRTNTDGSTSNFSNVPGITAPCWLELGRTNGNSLTASYSSDGTNWISVGTPQTVAMSTNAWVGLAVGSKNDLILNTATFDNVTITPVP